MQATPVEQEAQRLGFPATLFGFTPTERAYWFEPGLPWLTPETTMPLDYRGGTLLHCYAALATAYMAPRFPLGCVVNVTPVYERKNLVLGKVYLYVFREAGQQACQLGRLAYIGGNNLRVTFDNDPAQGIWLLREAEAEALWDVYELTHYVSYPEL